MTTNINTFLTGNGIKMLRCYPLNWRIGKTYVIDTDPNPIFYVIDIGSISDMWQATLIPETMIVSFTSLHYSLDEVYRFKVDSIEEGSNLVLKFAMGMNQLEHLKGTIYWN